MSSSLICTTTVGYLKVATDVSVCRTLRGSCDLSTSALAASPPLRLHRPARWRVQAPFPVLALGMRVISGACCSAAEALDAGRGGGLQNPGAAERTRPDEVFTRCFIFSVLFN